MHACMQDLSVKLLTSNLHLLLCQLTHQAIHMGDTVYLLELWVEGAIQKVKRKLLGNRGASAPEECINNELEFDRCVSLFQYAGPTPCKTPAQQKAEREQRRKEQRELEQQHGRRRGRGQGQGRRTTLCDDGDPPTNAGSKMVGLGARWSEEKDGTLTALLTKAIKLLEDMGAEHAPAAPAPQLPPAVDEVLADYDVLPMCPDVWAQQDVPIGDAQGAADLAHADDGVGEGWYAGLVQDLLNTGAFHEAVEVRVYARAALRHGVEQLYSRLYKRATKKDGSHVLVQYDAEPWVGVIEKFVSIKLSARPDLRPLRIALVNFYQRKPALGDDDVGTVHRVDLVPAGPWHDMEYPVMLDCIDGKLAYTSRTIVESGREIKERLLSKYIIHSAS